VRIIVRRRRGWRRRKMDNSWQYLEEYILS